MLIITVGVNSVERNVVLRCVRQHLMLKNEAMNDVARSRT